LLSASPIGQNRAGGTGLVPLQFQTQESPSNPGRFRAPNRGIAVAGLVLGLIGLVFYFLIGLASFGAGWII